MEREKFVQLMAEEFEQLLELNRVKGRDYAGDEDALRNFKEAAVRLGVSEEQVWAVYADKHWQAILSYCRTPEAVVSEPIEGRVRDLLVYGFLLLGLVSERKSKEAQRRADAVREGMGVER